MKTIKQKISRPYLFLIVAMPLLIFFAFNITVKLYSFIAAQNELIVASSRLEGNLMPLRGLNSNGTFEPNDGTDGGGDGNNRGHEGITSSDYQTNFAFLRNTLQISNFFESTDFVLCDATTGELLFPTDLSDSFLTTDIVQKAFETVTTTDENKPIAFGIGFHFYHAMEQPLTPDDEDELILLCISSGHYADQFVTVLNWILLGVSALIIGIFLIVSNKINNEITVPIAKLANSTKTVGLGDWQKIPDDHSSVELHHLTTEINEMSRRISSYDKAQRAFLQNASHELRTPLMSIQGYAEGIEKGVFSNSTETAAIITRESKRLNLLVDELLTLSRMENSNYTEEFYVLNLSDMLKEYVLRINGYAIKRDKTIVLDIKDSSVYANINNTLLEQAVINVISNCVKYAKSRVTVTLFEQGDLACIKISDDGDGITDKDLPHLFERFYKGKKGNFGLGLSISKTAIELLGGEISAYNQNGAVFVIHLPIVPPQ